MKQDPYYSAKVEATVAMGKATEYFAEFFLEEIKKLTEGKNRIDAKVLYDCISNPPSM
jgi:phage shock protein A